VILGGGAGFMIQLVIGHYCLQTHRQSQML
jgi:hypothetical protein